MYYGCLLYADDIVLLSPSVNGLQLMLDICLRTAADLSLQFNCSKSHCLVIGRAVDVKLQSLLLGDNHIRWSQSIKYLGVHVTAGKKLSFDVNHTLARQCESVLKATKQVNGKGQNSTP